MVTDIFADIEDGTIIYDAKDYIEKLKAMSSS
jgi:hypothetical protein